MQSYYLDFSKACDLAGLFFVLFLYLLTMKQLLVFLILVTQLAGCAAQPEVIKVRQPQDDGLSCAALSRELLHAQQLKAKAREEDRFQLKYMLVVPAILSMNNWTDAEQKADARIEHLSLLYQRKKCIYRQHQ